MNYRLCILCLSLLLALRSFSQDLPFRGDTLIAEVDSTIVSGDPRKSVAATSDPRPRNAALRSAILPGWGQIYNKKYWKLPLVYGALGVTGAIFVNNLKTYKESRFAYTARYKASGDNGQRVPTLLDSIDYFKLSPEYQNPLVSIQSIRNQRDAFRQYIDYSVLFFILFWGLNVVDASVDAHLQSFDVSPDLSLKIKPGHSEMANTTGLSLVLEIGRHRSIKVSSNSYTTY